MMFHHRGVNRLGRIDYSESLVETCRRVVKGELVCGEAVFLNTGKKYDLVMADSVFQYFASVDYARTVLAKMLEKTVKDIKKIINMQSQGSFRRENIFMKN